jgi:hypothetical protein
MVPRYLKQQISRRTIIQRSVSHIRGVIESEVSVKPSDLLDFFRREVEISAVQIFNQTFWIRGFGNDRQTALGGPSKEYLSRSLVILLCTPIDYRLIKKFRTINSLPPL